MSIQDDASEDAMVHILFCPFSGRCILPQKTAICKFPEYKQCPEYAAKLAKLKHKFGPIY